MTDDELQARLEQGIQKSRTAGDFMLAVADLLVEMGEHQQNMQAELSNADGLVQHERKRHAWRPIETAPKDGTRVLLGLQRRLKKPVPGYVEIGRWDGDHWAPYIPVDWTHWQPLPEGPEWEEG